MLIQLSECDREDNTFKQKPDGALGPYEISLYIGDLFNASLDSGRFVVVFLLQDVEELNVDVPIGSYYVGRTRSLEILKIKTLIKSLHGYIGS